MPATPAPIGKSWPPAGKAGDALRLATVGLFLAASGCTGEITGAEPPAGAPPNSPSPSGPSPEVTSCTDAKASATVLRRLTAQEYRNTVADLFSIAAPPTQVLPPDGETLKFRSTAGQLLTVAAASKYFDAAKAVAAELSSGTWFSCDATRVDKAVCVDEFLAQRGSAVFRRPVTDQQIAHYRELFMSMLSLGSSLPEAAAIMLQAILVSPEFLFLDQPQGEPGSVVPLDSWQLAARLSYTLWQSTPDAELLSLAGSGALSDAATRQQLAARMLEAPRARPVIESFFMQWLGLEDIERVQVDPAKYPRVTSALLVDLQSESRAFVNEVFWNRGADARRIFSAPFKLRNSALSGYYTDGTSGSDGVPSAVDAPIDERSFGLFSQAGFIMAISRSEHTAAIHRGKFTRTKLLCESLAPPPAGTVPPLPQVDPNASTREQISQHTAAPACAGCHSLMNPLGFPLEHFGPEGLWRDDERGLPIDASADLTSAGIAGSVDGARQLSEALGQSEKVHACMVDQMFAFALARSPTADEACLRAAFVKGFSNTRFDLKALLLDLVASKNFSHRSIPQD